MSAAPNETLYSLLGVPRDASDAAIKAAFREAAKLHHPDVNSSAKPGHFGRIVEAHEVLRDRYKRSIYDASLTTFGGGGGAAGSRGGGGGGRGGGGGGGEWTARPRTRESYHESWNANGYGNFSEDDLKARRAKEAATFERHAEEAAFWWRHEREHAERMKTQFTAARASAEGARAERVGRTLSGFWVTKGGVLWVDVAVAAASLGFVAASGALYAFSGSRKSTTVGVGADQTTGRSAAGTDVGP